MSSRTEPLEAIESITATKENMQSNNMKLPVTSSNPSVDDAKNEATTTSKIKKSQSKEERAKFTAIYRAQKVLVPTYESSEESDYYKNAKALLQSGDFETALSTIEEGIEWTKRKLAAKIPGSSDDFISLHESMAPFHYLYGTTLLYSIEESTDGLQPITTVEGGTTLAAVPEGENENEEDQGLVPGGSSHASSNYDDAANETTPAAADASDAVEDMEIAWENLETARTILEQLLLVQNSDQRRADLAQILLREGDLQRQNGAYAAAVTDYSACLSYYENNPCVPPFCRKIADVHCNLGAVHFHLVVETNKGPVDADGNATTDVLFDRDRPAKIIFYRNRGFYHYYECAKTLVGMISQLLCQTPPYELFQRVENSHSLQYPFCNERSNDFPKFIRSKLTALRQLVTQLTTPELAVSRIVELTLEETDVIQDSMAVLEEIQETLDEAETSEQGVVEAIALRQEITALVAAQQPPHGDDDPDTPAMPSHAFGSAAAAASTALAQPIHMIVKKKKKRTEEESMDEDGMDVKLPARDDGNIKRMKSNE